MTKLFRPRTPGQRGLVLEDHEQISKGAVPFKPLLMKRKRISGRNHHGHITCRHRGGGSKRAYRVIDFRRDKLDIYAKVVSIEYDPNRNAHIALLSYDDGEKRYILAPQGLRLGNRVVSTDKEEVYELGCSVPLKVIPLGSLIHNIELYPGRGAVLVRSAGLSAQLISRSGGYVNLKMPSGEIRMVNEKCRATFGSVSNAEHLLRVEGKAGRNRWKGKRPTVRGTAMNPVDHPHGGGEGKHNGYLPQTPWAICTKGFRTRSRKKSLKWIVKDRRK